MKRIIKSMGLALASLASVGMLASCGGNASAWEEDDYSEHVKIVYMTTGNPPTNNATKEMLEKLNEILTEKVNAELEISYVPWTNYQTVYNLRLSKMDGSVDLVGTASDWLDAWNNSKNGAFSSIPEDMLKKYAPQTYAQVPAEHWEMCKYNDEIYLIPEDAYTQWVNHGFMYRMDWAKEAGLADGVHSWEDLTTYFTYVKNNKPGVIPWDSSGQGSTYHAEGYIQSKSDFVVLDGINNYQMFGVRRSNLNKVYCPLLEGTELIDYARLMKKWDDLGVWKANVLNNTSSDNREEFYDGLTSVDQHHTQTWYTTVRSEMAKRQPGSDVNFFWFGEESGNLTEMVITHGAMAISEASKHKARALAVYDLLRNDEECYKLFNYGIEGRQYVINAEGLRETPEGYDSNKDAIVTDFWWGRNDAFELKYKDSKGAWDKFEEICEIYDKVKIPYPYGQIVWDVEEIQTQLNNISDVFSTYMGPICYGKTYNGKNTDELVKEFRDQLKNAGIDDVIVALQKQLDEFNASEGK